MPLWKKLLLVGLGGFVGAVLRYTLSEAVQSRTEDFPAGTLVVNAVGCLAIGVFLGLAEGGRGLSPELRHMILVGLLGSFTTFSTFAAEGFELLRAGRTAAALAYLTGNLVLGLVLVLGGRALGLRLGGGLELT